MVVPSSRRRRKSHSDHIRGPEISSMELTNSTFDSSHQRLVEQSTISMSSSMYDTMLLSFEQNPPPHSQQNYQQEQQQDQQPQYEESHEIFASREEEEEENQHSNENDVIQLDRSLCWRSGGMPNGNMMSDWTLQIFNRSTKKFDIYHVHKCVLAVGSKSCGYFQNVFNQQNKDHGNNNNKGIAFQNQTTRIPLISQACILFPTFLDYVYARDSFTINEENVVGLYYLADFFRNPSLGNLTMEFIETDLNESTCRENLHLYYAGCIYYDQHELLEQVLKACSRELLSMIENGNSVSTVLDELSPSHFIQILAEVPEPTEEDSNPISMTELISRYCALHQNELSMETFDEMTRRVTVLDSRSALTLLEVSLEYDFASYNNRNDETQDSTKSSLIFFQRECIGTLSEEWEDLLDLDQERITRIMTTLSLREEHQYVLVDWFQKTLIRASNQLTTIRKQKEELEQEHSALKDVYQIVAEDLEFAHNKYATLHKTYTVAKSEMKTQIVSWVQKNENQTLERMADEEQYKLDRSKFEMEKQKWEYEKYELQQQVRKLQQEKLLNNNNNSNNGGGGKQYTQSSIIYNNKNLLTFADDTVSVETEDVSEVNSLIDGEMEGYENLYPLTNGFSPSFRLF